MPKNKYPEVKPRGIEDPLEAVYTHVVTSRMQEFTHPIFSAPDLSGIHIGFSIVERFRTRSAPLAFNDKVDELVERVDGWTNARYDLDAIIASSAIELSYLKRGNTFLRRQRRVTDNRLTHLTKLGMREPYKSVAQTAILHARNSLVHQYSHEDRLSDFDGLVFCAQLIGEAVISAVEQSDDRQPS